VSERKALRIADGKGSIHVEDYGGTGRTVLLVHGLGGSHSNYSALAPLLARRARVVAIDLPGFGLTEPYAGSSIDALGAALSRVVDACAHGEIEGATAPLTLVGNSMGGALVILEAARRPERIAELVLICPAVPQPDLRALDPRFGLLLGASMLPGYDTFLRTRLEKAGPEAMVHEMLKLCTVDKARVPLETVREMEALARKRMGFKWMGSAFSEAARSIVYTLMRREKFHEAMRAVRAPTVLVHGDSDRLVPVGAALAAIKICPQWKLELLKNVGHVPQLEVPEKMDEVIAEAMGLAKESAA
jgi:pimeloyl-ACP methyl ester carboxylesterase